MARFRFGAGRTAWSIGEPAFALRRGACAVRGSLFGVRREIDTVVPAMVRSREAKRPVEVTFVRTAAAPLASVSTRRAHAGGAWGECDRRRSAPAGNGGCSPLRCSGSRDAIARLPRSRSRSRRLAELLANSAFAIGRRAGRVARAMFAVRSHGDPTRRRLFAAGTHRRRGSPAGVRGRTVEGPS
jgi:hypothetical protein